jgi:hypothetical protein
VRIQSKETGNNPATLIRILRYKPQRGGISDIVVQVLDTLVRVLAPRQALALPLNQGRERVGESGVCKSLAPKRRVDRVVDMRVYRAVDVSDRAETYEERQGSRHEERQTVDVRRDKQGCNL